MKSIVVAVLLVALVVAEPPRSSRFFAFQRNEQAPYQPSGYRPAGATFRLPERQQVPGTVYGPPQEYGPPEPATTTEADVTTTEMPTTTEYVPAKLQEGGDDVETGVYYIYHPNGLLQKITYSTKSDVKDMGYTAQLRYEDVQPIKDPIYTYDADTLVLQQIKL